MLPFCKVNPFPLHKIVIIISEPRLRRTQVEKKTYHGTSHRIVVGATIQELTIWQILSKELTVH